MAHYDIRIPKAKFLPVYHHLLDRKQFFDIDFLYGGRDSGKSRHVAMQLIAECLRPEYFKCLLVRKVLNTVRDSQYALIKGIIEQWKLRHLFKFNEARMEIICLATGNGFYGRGLDDVGRIKSFDNPSHCWVEEGNQIDKDDFVVILTSLRAEADVKTWFTFNPECEGTYTDFWLWQEWFSHTTQLSWTWENLIEVDEETYWRFPNKVIIKDSRYYLPLQARATHSTYRNNPYCKPQRVALYESYKTSKNNAYWYQTYTLGLWGYRKTGGAFWKCFEDGKHVKDTEWLDDRLHLIIDNNIIPYVSLQWWQVNHPVKQFLQQDEIACEEPNNTAVKAARLAIAYLRARNYTDILYLYGDPSINAKSTVDDEGRSFFDKFKAELTDAGIRFVDRVGKSAPGVALSGSFVNEIYESNHGGWSILINTRCRKSIEDYNMAKEDPNGGMLKTKEKDKKSGRSFERYGHFSDCKRYFITTVLAAEFNIFKAGSKRKAPTAVSR